MSEEKAVLRKRMATALKAMTPLERLVRSIRIQALLMATPEFKNARTLMVYQSDLTEVDTREIVMTCLDEGKRIGLPRAEKGTRAMQVVEIRDVQGDLEASRFGFKEPRANLPLIPVEEIDLTVVPGRAFDGQGHRLGRGGGYYDRFLARERNRALAVALAFELQMVEVVPHEGHDRRVDLIVTETRVIRRTW